MNSEGIIYKNKKKALHKNIVITEIYCSNNEPWFLYISNTLYELWFVEETAEKGLWV